MKIITKIFGSELLTEPTKLIEYIVPEDGPLMCPFFEKIVWSDGVTWDEFSPCQHVDMLFSDSEPSYVRDNLQILFEGIDRLSMQIRQLLKENKMFDETWSRHTYQQVMLTMLSANEARHFVMIHDAIYNDAIISFSESK